MATLTREEFLAHVEPLRAALHIIADRLDKLNDRTRSAEKSIAVLNDRASPVRAVAYGGSAGGIMLAVLEGMKWLVTNNRY